MKVLVFISNSSKPNKEDYDSLHEIKLDTVSRPCIMAAKKLGYRVILGVNRHYPKQLTCSETEIEFYDSHTYRSILHFKDNYIAIKNLCKVLKNNDIEAIHCNAPIGGMVGRICGKIYKVPKIIYTAHGFHFYKGAPLFNNTIIKGIERMMAHWTNAILTMNKEDFEATKKMKLKNNGKSYFIHGVGVDTKAFLNSDEINSMSRESLGLKESDIICISIGNLVKSKNLEASLMSVSKLNNDNVHLLICGIGPELNSLKKMTVDLNVEHRIHFLGFRNDVKSLLKISDIFLFTTLREGLPRSLMEAMASGLPCVVSDIRGNKDLIKENEGGYLCNPQDIDLFSARITELSNNEGLRKKMGNLNQNVILNYDTNRAEKEIQQIYKEVLLS